MIALSLLLGCPAPYELREDPALDEDHDLDGYTPNQGDCDDDDPSVVPLAFVTEDGGWEDWSEELVQAAEDHQSVEIAVDRDGTLRFCEGTWDVKLTLEGDRILRIESVTGTATTLDGGRSHRIVEAQGLTYLELHDINLHHGSSKGDGGAVFVAEGAVGVQGGTFVGNEARSGGAFHVGAGALDVREASMNQNHASADGGALHLGEGVLSITDAELRDNVAVSDGGAAWVGDGSLSATETLFVDNLAHEAGGALGSATGDVFVAGGNVSRNEAGDESAAIDVVAGEALSLEGVSLASNVPVDVAYGEQTVDMGADGDLDCTPAGCE